MKKAEIQSKPMTRRVKTGQQMADALIDMIHMMYQRQTALGVLDALIGRLRKRREEFSQ